MVAKTLSRSTGSHPVTFAELMSQGVLEIGDGYRAKNEELGGDGPIFLRAGHVSNTHIDFEGVERFREPLPLQLRHKFARAGDVIVTSKGWSTGRVSYVLASMPEFVYSPHLSYWRSLNPDVVDPGFLRYWSRSPECQRQLNSIKMTIDIHPYLSLATQRTLHISLPDPKDQKAIAYVLGALDDKIDLLRRMNLTQEQICQTFFQLSFVGTLGEQTAVGDRASDQELAGLATYLSRGLSPSYVDVGGVPVINQKCVRNHKVDLTKARRHDPSKKSISGREVRRYDILVNSTGVGTLGRVAQIWGDIGTAIVDSHVTVVRANEHVHPLWLGLALFNKEPELERLGEGTTGQTELSRKRLGALRMIVPAREHQDEFARHVAPLVERLFANEVHMVTLAETRDTLLPNLLSGTLRISDPERLLKEAGV